MYCNNRKKKKYNNNNSSSSSSGGSKCYITTIILYVCLLNIVINNVSLSNEDNTIISKQEFQKLLDMKHNITGLKKISETMFEIMFNNTNDDDKEEEKYRVIEDDEIKPTTIVNDVSIRENKGLNDRTTDGIIGDGGEREEEQVGKETDNISEEVIVEKIESPRLGELFQIYDKMIHYCCDVSSNHKETQQDVRKIFLAINELTKKFSFLNSLQPAPQEIAEIVNKAISSYNEANKKNTEELNKKIDEVNKQNNKELNLYHTQIIQMFKDLIENVNKLNNKIDRLERISQKKETTKKATQSTVQTFVNGSYSSKKIYIENISNEDLECEEDLIIRDKTIQNDEVVKAIKPVEMNSSIFDKAQRIINRANTQQPLQGQDREIIGEQLQFDPSQMILLENRQISLINSCLHALDREVRTLQDENEELLLKNNEQVLILKLIYNEEQKRMLGLQQTIDALKKYRENHTIETDKHIQFVKKCMTEQVSINKNFTQLIRAGYKGMQYEQEEVTEDQKQQQDSEKVFDNIYNILKLAHQNIMDKFTSLNSELLVLANAIETVKKEEVKKNVLSIEEIKKEILNAKLSSDMVEIENYAVIKKLFEDNYGIIVKACQDGEDINFIGFAESFLPENEPETYSKINILNQLFNKVVEPKTQPQQELLNVQTEKAEEVVEEGSEQEKISNQRNDVEGSQKPHDVPAKIDPTQHPSTDKTPKAGMPVEQQQSMEDRLNKINSDTENLIRLKNADEIEGFILEEKINVKACTQLMNTQYSYINTLTKEVEILCSEKEVLSEQKERLEKKVSGYEEMCKKKNEETEINNAEAMEFNARVFALLDLTQKRIVEQLYRDSKFGEILKANYERVECKIKTLTVDEQEVENKKRTELYNSIYNSYESGQQDALKEVTALKTELLALAGATETVEKEENKKDVPQSVLD